MQTHPCLITDIHVVFAYLDVSACAQHSALRVRILLFGWQSGQCWVQSCTMPLQHVLTLVLASGLKSSEAGAAYLQCASGPGNKTAAAEPDAAILASRSRCRFSSCGSS